MNKKMKRLLILLGVLVVICIATVAVSQYQEKQEQIAATEDVILTIEAEDATALSWEIEDADEGSFAFTLTDGSWIYADDEAFPVDPDVIESLLEIFTEFTASFIIEEVEDFSQYGLSDPCATITITTEETEYVIEMGDYSTMDSQRYVSIGDGNVYLVSTDPLDYYELALDDLILNDSVPYFDEVSEIRIDGDEVYTIVYDEESEYAYIEDDVYYAEIDGETLTLESTSVSSYLTFLTYTLDLTGYVTYNVTEDELTEYGFDDPELEVSIDYTDVDEDDESGEEIVTEGTFVITVARDADQIAAAEAAEEASDEEDEDDEDDEDTIAAYVRIGDSTIIYGITSDEYESLLAVCYDDLRYDEIFPLSTDEITAVSVTIGDESYELTTEIDEEEEGQIWYYNGEEVDGSAFTSSLSGMDAESFTDDADVETAEISISFTMDNENYPSVEITFYRYDGEYCVVEVDGVITAYVSRSDTMELVETINTIVLN